VAQSIMCRNGKMRLREENKDKATGIKNTLSEGPPPVEERGPMKITRKNAELALLVTNAHVLSRFDVFSFLNEKSPYRT